MNYLDWGDVLRKQEPAELEYLGESGTTGSCRQAVINLIHAGCKIEKVKILTLEGKHSRSHALLLVTDFERQVLIKDGFSSGYSGEGPRGYAFVINLLSRYTENIDEYIIPEKLYERLIRSSLTTQDMKLIDDLNRVRPARWFEFAHYVNEDKMEIYKEFPLTIPMALIDNRLIDIALDFDRNPDSAILNAYRKIESVVRERTGLTQESSTKLFSKAFLGEESVLYWENIDSGESKGRASFLIVSLWLLGIEERIKSQNISLMTM